MTVPEEELREVALVGPRIAERIRELVDGGKRDRDLITFRSLLVVQPVSGITS